MATNYIEVRIRAGPDADLIVALLDSDRLLGTSETEGSVSLYWEEAAWAGGERESLWRVIRRAGADPDKVVRAVVPVAGRDWNEAWMRSLQPVRVGRRIWVRQSWNRINLDLEEMELIIDPRRAFGSGYHATTQMLIQLLERRLRGGECVIDLGTGSGILAMAALRLGARYALAVDSDPEAIECAWDNAVRNGFDPELELRIASVDELPPGEFDLVLANLDRNLIMRAGERILAQARSGGIIMLSGLLQENLEEVVGKFFSLGSPLIGAVAEQEWVAAEFLGR